MTMDMNKFHLLCIAVLLGSCQGKQPETKAATTAPVATTEVVAVKKDRLESSLHLPGELIAYQQVDLYAKENSFVKKLYVDVGSEVAAGQLLVTMEAPELQSQLAGALSTIKSREATYLGSKAVYDRLFETSKTPGTIAPTDLDQAEARKNADYAQLQAAKAAYQQAAELEKYLQIRAPFAGVISARNVNAGAYVGPAGKGSELPLFTLQEQKKLRLVLSVPEAYSAYVTANNEVDFTVKALPNQHFKAKINRLAGALDKRLHAQRIEMDVLNPKKVLLPGMVAEVNLPLPANDSSFVVPKSAVVNSTQMVFVVRVNKGQSEWVPVKTGREANGLQEVFGALQTGDQVVKTATDEIRNGSALPNIKLVTE